MFVVAGIVGVEGCVEVKICVTEGFVDGAFVDADGAADGL